jgi:hypothetical protein
MDVFICQWWNRVITLFLWGPPRKGLSLCKQGLAELISFEFVKEKC